MNHESLHARAMATAKEYLKCEAELIGVFQELERHRTFERYGCTSLFAYATKILRLSEATTVALIRIARAALEVPELKSAIEEKKISFSNARRIAPVLKRENKTEWLIKAEKLPLRALELELAKNFPERPAPTRVIAKSEKLGRLEIDLPHTALAKLKRAQEVLSQKKKVNIDAAKALEIILDEFVDRHDPLEKAKRSVDRRAQKVKHKPLQGMKKLPVARQVEKTESKQSQAKMHSSLISLARRMGFKIHRKPISAKEKHAVTLRDNAQCTYRYPDGSRCESKQWLHVHHIEPHSNGGTDHASNLRTLCSTHHKTLHT